ncbi:hypothetical protein J437_LFUL001295 [Ladona fulva]|uniref:Caspase 3 n=1 Tax=Ladona fulva TaxID=123851 RepID=A0A8K0JTJ6_LADFU|nr:hypothetical protein J437_LFUL001295 [Ladona fulva]
MTHGDQSGRLEAKDFSYNAEEVWDYFKDTANLAGKPKIFIFQACRGSRKEEGVGVLQSGGQRGLIIPSHADYLMVYSCFEGYSSYIDPNHGSWFIQDFCKDLNEYAFTEDMLSILTHTMRRAAYTRCYETEGNGNKTDRLLQMPAFSSTLTKLLYFYDTSS